MNNWDLFIVILVLVGLPFAAGFIFGSAFGWGWFFGQLVVAGEQAGI